MILLWQIFTKEFAASRQCDVGHQRRQLLVLTRGRKQVNRYIGMRGAELRDQQWQVFTGMFTDSEEKRKDLDAAGASRGHFKRSLGQRRRAQFKVGAANLSIGLAKAYLQGNGFDRCAPLRVA